MSWDTGIFSSDTQIPDQSNIGLWESNQKPKTKHNTWHYFLNALLVMNAVFVKLKHMAVILETDSVNLHVNSI